MDAPAHVRRGARALSRLLREQTFDLRSLDLEGFRRWLDRQLVRWREDPVFLQRARIRDLRRAHPPLQALEDEYRRAVLAEAASPQSARLRALEQELLDTGKAVAGLTAALAGAGPERRPALGQKLEAFQARQQLLRQEQESLTQASPQWQRLRQLTADLQQLRSVFGLDREESCLEELLQRQGRHSGRVGDSFEHLALALTEKHIIPDLLRGGGPLTPNPSPPRGEGRARGLRVLQGVTLGAARIEFDQLVIRQPRRIRDLSRRPERPVEVLAAVEVKRNLNDLAHGFRQRQENLAWLTGATAHYDAGQYRTNCFRTGHFDREATHEQAGETFLFDRGSFRLFRRDPATDLILGRLYFIARARPLWGVSTAALARIGARIATAEGWEPESDAYLRKLLGWCRSLAVPTETPDVLRMYLSAPRLARHVLVVGR